MLAQLVAQAGRLLSFTPTEFRLLVALARRRGRVASHADLLSEVARMTGGRYFRARDAAALRSVYDQIDRL
jgi:DNA-binding response OmpR family regulator